MSPNAVGIIVNGATGRMGYRQHLVRSLLALRSEGGVRLADGSLVPLHLMLVGRSEPKLEELSIRHSIPDWTTDLDLALNDPRMQIYFDAQITSARAEAVRRALDAVLHVYVEKPVADSYQEAMELAALAQRAGVKHGVVHDKLFLPGIRKLKVLVESGFFGRVLSVRLEFGYWVFEGDWLPAQRPSWNYRKQDGGGIVLDMFPHWGYLLEDLFGPIQDVFTVATTHIPHRVDELGVEYPATADDAAYAILRLPNGVIAQVNSSWSVRVNRDELVELQIDGTHGSAVVGLHSAKIQPRWLTPRPVWNPDESESHDYRSEWSPVPDREPAVNGFRAQWEQFLRHVVADEPYNHDLFAGARGLRLAEAALTSSASGRVMQLHSEGAAL